MRWISKPILPTDKAEEFHTFTHYVDTLVSFCITRCVGEPAVVSQALALAQSEPEQWIWSWSPCHWYKRHPATGKSTTITAI